MRRIHKARTMIRISLLIVVGCLTCIGSIWANGAAQNPPTGDKGKPSLRLEKLETVDLRTGKVESNSRDSRFNTLDLHALQPPPPVEDTATCPAQGEFMLKLKDGSIQLLRVATGETARTFLPSSDLQGIKARAAALSPDGKFVAVYFHLRQYPSTKYDVVSIYDLATGKIVKEIQAEVSSDIKFSRCSTLLAFTSKYDRGTLRERSIAEVWEVGTWKKRVSIDPPLDFRGLSSLDISPDDKLIALAGLGKFGIYPIPSEATQAQEPQKLEALMIEIHSDPDKQMKSMLFHQISDIKFSPDGKIVNTLGEDGKMIKWGVRKQ